ncbi:TPA: hypothetical protein EYN98_19460 [Candidatus Poribacteria bacterium]|nr:hypothetical protein [Candidatus Poribacteria bacterium]HIA68180.1 hypothetical protein [Candidatus Poribacteria bacterium]HIB98082.1 hypothetical protein [Candidatus Poribacteria bacterium]HIC18336.1 hypothetical protein [Candidatus Poribacteria bacterium]HIN28869.1 hypothetical protein [Candidatus Poribacteria bacterium]
MDNKDFKGIMMNAVVIGLAWVKRIPIDTLTVLFLLAVVQPLWHGYQFGVSDHSIQLSIMNRFMDPTLYPDDPMLETEKGYVSFYPRLMTLLIKAISNREALYFVLHILSYFFYFAMLYHISRFLFDEKSAILCLALMATRKIVLGGSSIHFTGLYPSFFTLAFVLLAIYLFLKEKYAIAYTIMGISLNFHTLVAGHAACMLLCYSLLCVISRKIRVRELAKCVGIFVFCASPTIIWILSTRGKMTDEWIWLLRVRSSHHSFPLSWSSAHYVNYLLFLSTGALSFIYIPRLGPHRKILAFVLAIGGLCVIGLIFSEYYPVKFVLQGQLFRSTNFLTIFCVIYISNYLYHCWQKSVLHKVTTAVIFISLFLPSNFNLLVLGLILAVIAENLVRNNNRSYKQSDDEMDKESPSSYFSRLLWISIFVLVAILIRSLLPHDSFPASFSLNSIISLIQTFFEDRLLIYIICAAIIIGLFTNSMNLVHKLSVLVIMVLLVIIHIVPSAYKGFHSEDRDSQGWRGVQTWARKNTRKTDLFLTPPYMTGFRIFSQRPIVGEWKDGTQQYFDAEYSYEWWRRMRDMKLDGSGGRDFDKLGKTEYQKLAEKYGASYLVLSSKIPPGLPKIYDNNQYSVYQLGDSQK